MQAGGSPIVIDPYVAQHMLQVGATLIIAGVPVGTEFGIDLSSYEVGERFRGVKMIPPGPHYVFCAARDSYGTTAPRVGFAHYFKPCEIVVREWDLQTEELRIRQCEDIELEKQRIRENLKDLDRFLAPYDFKELAKWKSLTDTITEDVLCRCTPQSGFIRNSMEFLSCPDSERPRGGAPGNYKNLPYVADESELLPNLKPLPDTALNFKELPPRIPKGVAPSEVTRHHLDCIEAVDAFFAKFSDQIEAIQEIQLAFIFFCSGYSVDSLAHWRKTLNLLSNSETAVDKYMLFYMKYLEILQFQLPELPEELMEQTKNNTVCRDVRSLLQNCAVAGLHISADRMAKRLKKTMKWKFDGLLDEDPEDMPVVVDNAD